MRILATVDSVGGVWRYALDLAAALATRGVQTTLAHLGPPPTPAQRAETTALPRVTLIETGLPLDWLCADAAAVRSAGEGIGELARTLGVDLLQLNSPTLAGAACSRLPTVVAAHGCVSTWWQGARPGTALDAAYGWHTEFAAQGLRTADLAVAPTAAYARDVARRYGLARAPRAVHNGRAPAPLVADAAIDDRALTVGRLWDAAKRAALLDRAAAVLAAPFDAIGPIQSHDGERVELSHLRLLGELDSAEVRRRFAARPVFVSAAAFEPFGLAVLEAAQAGCALVLSDIATFRELWDGAARFVPGEDAGRYVQAIAALVADPAERRRLGEAARARSARYGLDALAEGMLAVYADAIAAHTQGGRVAA